MSEDDPPSCVVGGVTKDSRAELMKDCPLCVTPPRGLVEGTGTGSVEGPATVTGGGTGGGVDEDGEEDGKEGRMV